MKLNTIFKKLYETNFFKDIDINLIKYFIKINVN